MVDDEEDDDEQKKPRREGKKAHQGMTSLSKEDGFESDFKVEVPVFEEQKFEFKFEETSTSEAPAPEQAAGPVEVPKFDFAEPLFQSISVDIGLEQGGGGTTGSGAATATQVPNSPPQNSAAPTSQQTPATPATPPAAQQSEGGPRFDSSPLFGEPASVPVQTTQPVAAVLEPVTAPPEPVASPPEPVAPPPEPVAPPPEPVAAPPEPVAPPPEPIAQPPEPIVAAPEPVAPLPENVTQPPETTTGESTPVGEMPEPVGQTAAPEPVAQAPFAASASPPAESSVPVSTGSSTMITDRHGARLYFDRKELKPNKVEYPNGSTSEFNYDKLGWLVRVKENTGVVWDKLDNPDEHGQALWRSNRKEKSRMTLSVLPDGTYQRTDAFGTLRTYATNGSATASLVFSEGFNISSLISRVFTVIDKDKNGSLSAEELSIAALRHWYDANEAKLVSMLKIHFDSLMKQQGSSEAGITIDSITRFDTELRAEQQRACEAPPYVLHTLNELFTEIDKNQNDSIELEELEQALETIEMSDAQREIVGALADQFRKIAATEQRAVINKGQLLSVYASVFRQEVAHRTATVGWGLPLELNPQFPSDNISLLALQRGTYGDCVFATALASLVAVSPQSVMKLITANGNGTFTVDFPGGHGPIMVEAPAPYDFALHTAGMQYGAWPVVLEKAYETYLQTHEKEKEVFPPVNAQGMTRGCLAIRLLTGGNGKWRYINQLPPDNVAYLIEECGSAGIPLVCAPLGFGERMIGEVKIINNQTHSIIGWSRQDQTMYIRNPWGVTPKGISEKDASANGSYPVPMAEFMRFFNLMYVPESLQALLT